MAFEASFSSAALEPRSPISTPAVAPSEATVAAPEPAAAAAAPVPLYQKRPAPGTFMFLPIGAPWESCSTSPGDPTGHPVLVFPATNDDPEKVKVLFTTTKDIKENCKARSWGENYLPLGNQVHPWREPVALCGSFPRPTSLNITSEYTVPWSCLEDLTVSGSGVPAPCLSPQGLEKVNEFVKCPRFDKNIRWIRDQAPVAPAKRDDSVPYKLRPAAAEFYPRQNSYPAHINKPWRRN
ncbi:hypothetical protein KCU77_g4479, partial [Aureobasidium melanogenum]